MRTNLVITTNQEIKSIKYYKTMQLANKTNQVMRTNDVIKKPTVVINGTNQIIRTKLFCNNN